jgi:two-component system, OmpR family, phosphate regulon sensor histidine kinase PhoR
MRKIRGHSETAECNDNFRTAGVARPVVWSMTATARPHKASDFEAVLLALVGHDIRQPLQVMQSAHEVQGLRVRTNSELRRLRSGQNAIDRLNKKLEQILIALRVREYSRRLELRPVRVHLVLQQACRENEQAALSKGISIHMVSSDVSILSDRLLLGAALRNLVSNAIKNTQPGGRVLVGCRHSSSSIRIDVYDTGVGIPGEQLPKISGAFTRLNAAPCDGLGIGLLIVRQAIGILGHRIDIVSTPRRGTRFSIFVARVGFRRDAEDLMSAATHFHHAPVAARVRVYDTQAARRQFQISMILILILIFAAFAFGHLVRFDAIKGDPVTGTPSRAHQVEFASGSMNVQM